MSTTDRSTWALGVAGAVAVLIMVSVVGGVCWGNHGLRGVRLPTPSLPWIAIGVNGESQAFSRGGGVGGEASDNHGGDSGRIDNATDRRPRPAMETTTLMATDTSLASFSASSGVAASPSRTTVTTQRSATSRPTGNTCAMQNHWGMYCLAALTAGGSISEDRDRQLTHYQVSPYTRTMSYKRAPSSTPLGATASR